MDLDAMLTQAAPARYMPAEGPDSASATRLLEQIISQPPGTTRRRRRRTRIIVAVATPGMAMIMAIVAITGVARTPRYPDSPVAAVLDAAAVTASQQPPQAAPGSGQYEYLKTIQGARYGSGNGSGNRIAWHVCFTSQTLQYWVAADGSGHMTASVPPPCIVDGVSIGTFGSSSQAFKGPEYELIRGVYPDAASLPADPAALEHLIEQQFLGGKPSEGGTFQYAGTFLQSAAPPAVRAALYRLIEGLPGIELAGPMTDRVGRHGIAVRYTTDSIRYTLIFDPATSAVLEYEEAAARLISSESSAPPIRPGDVIVYTVYLESGLVNSATAVPASPSQVPSPPAPSSPPSESATPPRSPASPAAPPSSPTQAATGT